MPDVVGARVIVDNVMELEKAMLIIENRFGDNIYEKDERLSIWREPFS